MHGPALSAPLSVSCGGVSRNRICEQGGVSNQCVLFERCFPNTTLAAILRNKHLCTWHITESIYVLLPQN